MSCLCLNFPAVIRWPDTALSCHPTPCGEIWHPAPIKTSCGLCCPKPGLGILMRGLPAPSLCLAEQVSSSGCFLAHVSELPADKEAFVLQTPFHRQMAGDSGAQPPPIGVGVWSVVQDGHRATVYHVDSCFRQEPIIVTTPSIGQLLTNEHHLAVAFSLQSGWEGQRGPLRNSHSALRYRW